MLTMAISKPATDRHTGRIAPIRHWQVGCVGAANTLRTPAITVPATHQYGGRIGKTKHRFLTGYNRKMIGYEKN